MTAPADQALDEGPFFEDLALGWRHEGPFGRTIDEAHGAWYSAMSGDPAPLFLDASLARAVTRAQGVPVNPALVAQISIGQSTSATRQVVANLFYRDLVMHRQVTTGSTLFTSAEVVAACEATPRPDRPARGKVVLAVSTRDQDGNPVLSYERCALVRKQHHADTSRRDDVGTACGRRELRDYASTAPGWHLDRFPGPAVPWLLGSTRVDLLREPVTDPLSLVRLSGNLARAHRDPAFGIAGRRLVYGGHTLALAQAALSRLANGIVTVLGWRTCEHPGPVFEDDLLQFSATPLNAMLAGEGLAVTFEVTAVAVGTGRDEAGHGGAAQPSGDDRPVLHWEPVVFLPAGAVAGSIE